MMPETNWIAISHQLAKNAAIEAIKSLFPVYWADSFESSNPIAPPQEIPDHEL